MLAMYGSDHTAPAADLADLLERHNRRQPAEGGVRLRLATMAEYFAAQPTGTAGLRAVHGELRSHARANILPGVLSARAPLKQAMARAERAVERYAEPPAALWLDETAQRFLEMAWHRLIEVSCHDSVTGCGCDETAQQVAARIAEAEQLGLAVRDMVGKQLTSQVPHDAHLLLNPTPTPRTDLVELDVAGDGPVHLTAADGTVLPAQRTAEAPTLLADDTVPADRLPTVLARVHGSELYGQEITSWHLDPAERLLHFTVARRSEAGFDVAEVRGTRCPPRGRKATGGWSSRPSPGSGSSRRSRHRRWATRPCAPHRARRPSPRTRCARRTAPSPTDCSPWSPPRTAPAPCGPRTGAN